MGGCWTRCKSKIGRRGRAEFGKPLVVAVTAAGAVVYDFHITRARA